jgi:hypothetical protein
MKTILSLALYMISFHGLTQDSVSVLFIGNSYIYTNDLPNTFKNLALSLGDITTIDSKTNGGYTFQNQVNDPLTFQKIHSKPWDYVILQGQSQEASFPYGQVNSATLPFAMQLADSVYANTPCTQAQFFMTWGRQIGDPQWDSINTFNKMNKRLRDAYLRIADSTHSSVAAAGPAWKYTIDNYPSINLFSSDGSHPSIAGTYLNACVFYSSILKKSPVGASYLAGLDQPTATILQNIAALTVLDSSSVWRLKHHDSLAQVDFTFVEGTNSNDIQFQATGDYISNYSWSFGDDFYSNEQSPIHIFGYNGVFPVELVGTGACGSDTVVQLITINTVQVQEFEENNFTIIQTGENLIEINLSNDKLSTDPIEIYSVSGERIPFKTLNSSDTKHELYLTAKGGFFIVMNASLNPIVKRFFLN